jgi:hypothetical protein
MGIETELGIAGPVAVCVISFGTSLSLLSGESLIVLCFRFPVSFPFLDARN